METIVRTDGHVNIFKTVVKTIRYLDNIQSGFYSIADIQTVINAQIHPSEFLTRKMVVRAIVKIAENHNKIVAA